MYTRVLATDVSFLNSVRPWLPDFVQKEVAGPLGMVMAIGFAVLVVGGVILLVKLAFNQNQHGDASTATSQILWWILGVVGLSILIPLVVLFAG